LAARPPGARDLCPVCGMVVAKYPNWIASVVWRDGHAHHFDGAKDMFKFLHDLPRCMARVDFILLGQVEKSFVDAKYDVLAWERVHAVGRRRRMHFDGTHTLATFIVSRSDIDDLIPMLTAYQIEWNKLHWLLKGELPRLFLAQHADRESLLTAAEIELLSTALKVAPDDLRRLEMVWGDQFLPTLNHIATARKQIGLRLIAGSQADYRRATAYWWETVYQHTRHASESAEAVLDLEDRPVYFVSSNTHSLINLMTGFALREERAILDYMEDKGHETLLSEYNAIMSAEGRGANDHPNFLYYALKKFLGDQRSPTTHAARERVRADQRTIGIYRIPSKHGIDIETQVMQLSRLLPDWLDPRLTVGRRFDWLPHSDAVIVNIDYPLGLGAYEIMARMAERATRLLGVYVMGKAATLNGRVGDVMLPNVVHDEHSGNTYLFNNCFSAERIAPYMRLGMVLDNQKAISAPGTFLQNRTYMSVFYREGYTIIEMEAGPYLSAIYEAVRPKRHPQDEIVALHGAPFEIGFLHYASDTPFTKGHNLGAGSLSYAGVESTYATAIAILERIFAQEAARLRR